MLIFYNNVILKEDNARLSEMIKIILDPSKGYYMIND